MAMSIAHRITGVGLYVGVLLLAWFLLAASMDASAFAYFSGFIQSIFGRLMLFGFTWALFHHMLGGVRHLIMDAGYGMDDPEREQMAQATLIGGFALTIVVWTIAYAVREERHGEYSNKSLRTPLGRVRLLGSARLGAQDEPAMRLTSVALVPLTFGFVWLVLRCSTRTITACARNSASRCRRSSCCFSFWSASTICRSA